MRATEELRRTAARTQQLLQNGCGERCTVLREDPVALDTQVAIAS